MNVKNKKILSYVVSVFMSILTAAMLSFGIKLFISPNKFLSTGFTGVALIIGRIVDKIFNPEVSLETTIAGILLFVFNIPIFLLAWKKLTKKFAILSFIHILFTTLFLAIIPDTVSETFHLSVANGDITYLDAALFVGLLNGTGNALAYIFAGSSGGADVITVFFSIKKQKSIGQITTVINAFIILGGILVDGGESAIAKAFYTLVYIVISSIVIDLFYVRNKRKILLITTSKGNEVNTLITKKYIRGVTRMDATGGFTGDKKELLYSACLSYEVDMIIKEIKEIDEHAFVTILDANKVQGNFINKEVR